MTPERSCGWMSGPKGASVHISPVKWWLAVSRDVIAKGYRQQHSKHRPPVACHLQPAFSSPLTNR